MRWTEEEIDSLFSLKEQGYSSSEIAEKMTAKHGRKFTERSIRSQWQRLKDRKPDLFTKTYIGYSDELSIKSDGTQSSDKLIAMSDEQRKDPTYLLEAHGYNPDEWEIVSSKSSMWNHHNKKDGTKTLYASKISVKPKQVKIDWDYVLNKIQDVPQVTVKPKYVETDIRYLNIPLFDMHLGISTYDDYKPTQAKILHLIKNGYKELLIPIGSDMFHHNDHRHRTASGREIEQTDMTKAWEYAVQFYEPIIKEGLRKCGRVSVVFIKGNHDESLSWAFTKYLEGRFPQVNFNTDFKERKVHMLGTNFIGLNHGDKKKEKDITENFATEFPNEWSKATTREVFVGHLHSERVLDKGGVLIRRMPTRNKADQWHQDMGYTTAHKRFQIFEYSEHELESIHYV